MIIYLDNCVLNRPFDNQDRLEIRLETEAKIHIQEEIKAGKLKLVWSYILEFENAQNPFHYRRALISRWKKIARYHIFETNDVLKRARQYQKKGLKAKDALHISCAIEAGADYFITTDREIIRKMQGEKIIRVINPVSFVLEREE